MKIAKIDQETLDILQKQGAQVEFICKGFHDLPLDFRKNYDGSLVQNYVIDGKYKVFTVRNYKYNEDGSRIYY